MYYIEENNNILTYSNNISDIHNSQDLFLNLKYLPIRELDDSHTIIDYKIVTLEEAEEIAKEKEHARIMELKMTPLDFLKAIEKYGITYDMVKQFMEQNPLIERELRFCQNVYRKHPMLDALQDYGITSEILDDIFIQANKKEE